MLVPPPFGTPFFVSFGALSFDMSSSQQSLTIG
jgi:hypothetical protein